jgi:hypothetical protein
MAATKWDDTGTDWENEELGTLIRGAWNAIKEASDERNAYYNATDDTGFDAAETWPTLSDWLLKFKNNPSPTNWANVMTSALQYTEASIPGTVDPDSITTSGVGWWPTPPGYDILTTQDILESFGWPATLGQRLIHMVNSDDGDKAGLITKEWLKQWYQVLNFNVYNRSALSDASAYTDEVEKFYIKIEIRYTWSGGSFSSASADVTNPEFNTPVDIYVTGDLPESTKATYQDVLDYGQDIFETYFDDNDKWESDSLVNEINRLIKSGSEADLVGNGTLQLDITYRGFRFKRLQGYRPTTGQRFDQEVWWNGYYIIVGDDSGTGETNREIKFIELPEDATSKWIYFAVLSNQGATPFAAPDISGSYTDSTVSRSTLNEGTGSQSTVLFRPNLTDGTGFEYYTPAP